MTEININPEKFLRGTSLKDCVGFIGRDNEGKLMFFIVVQSEEELKSVINLSVPNFEETKGYTANSICALYNCSLLTVFHSMEDFKLTVSLRERRRK